MTQTAGNCIGEECTNFYRMSRGSFAVRLFMHHAMWLLSAMLILISGAVAASFITSDLAWAILALMLLFIVVPMVLAFSYYSHAFKPVTVCNTLLHSVAFSDEGLKIYLAGESEDSDLPEIVAVREFPVEKFLRWKVDSGGAEIHMSGNDGGFIYLPYESFRSESQLRGFVETASRLIKLHGNDNAS